MISMTNQMMRKTNEANDSDCGNLDDRGDFGGSRLLRQAEAEEASKGLCRSCAGCLHDAGGHAGGHAGSAGSAVLPSEDHSGSIQAVA